MARRYYPTLAWNQKEAHRLRVPVEKDCEPYAVNTATISMWCKRKLDSTTTGYLFTKTDGDFTKSVEGDPSIIEVDIDETDLDFAGESYCIIQYDKGANEKPKSIFRLVLTRSPEG